MVFDGEQYEGNNRNALNRFQALRAASAVKILGKGVIKVVHRVDDAKENNNLGKKKNEIYVFSGKNQASQQFLRENAILFKKCLLAKIGSVWPILNAS